MVFSIMRFSTVIGLVIVLVGCQAPVNRTAYVSKALAGSYSGTFELPHAAIQGMATLTIFDQGQTSGVLTDSSANVNETISGSMSGTGQFVGSSKYPGEGTNQLKGTFRVTDSGGVEAHLVERRGKSSTSIVLKLHRD